MVLLNDERDRAVRALSDMLELLEEDEIEQVLHALPISAVMELRERLPNVAGGWILLDMLNEEKTRFARHSVDGSMVATVARKENGLWMACVLGEVQHNAASDNSKFFDTCGGAKHACDNHLINANYLLAEEDVRR